jgi:predicted DNA-binding transcriptional regulator YafY
MNNKHSKNSRTLSMYVRLCAGKRINKAEEANRFGVDERSIQRDIDDIRAFLEDQKAESTAESREIVYDRIHKGFVMTGTDGSAMSNSEILAVSKILLEGVWQKGDGSTAQ